MIRWLSATGDCGQCSGTGKSGTGKCPTCGGSGKKKMIGPMAARVR